MHGFWRSIPLYLLTAVCLPAVAQSSFLGISLDARFPGEMSECPTKEISGMEFLDTNRGGFENSDSTLSGKAGA